MQCFGLPLYRSSVCLYASLVCRLLFQEGSLFLQRFERPRVRVDELFHTPANDEPGMKVAPGS